MSDSGSAEGGEGSIGYHFANPNLFIQAMSHASLDEARGGDNERLEFLGDRVLGLLIAEVLLERHPRAREGELAARLNAVVRRETCAAIARDLNLGPMLRISKSEDASGGRDKPNILADACEALIAAIYLDGGLEAARGFVRRVFGPVLETGAPIARDGKSALQEWSQARGKGLPRYDLVERAGPDHAPVFTIEVSIAGHHAARAQGASRRAAEQAAADTWLAQYARLSA